MILIKYNFSKLICLFSLLLFILPLFGQSKYSIEGFIYETERRTLTALPSATILMQDYSIGTMSDENGFYRINDIPEGEVRLSISFVGKVKIDTLIRISSNLHVDFTLKEDNFRLRDVVVTAQINDANPATSSIISRTAMEHLQATSLKDALSLLPGAVSQNQDLNYASQINIRSVSTRGSQRGGPSSLLSDASNANALGTLIIQDGAPVSNNANLQTMHPAVLGASASLGGNASPSGGVDLRSISVENIESVEVIRGIVPVEYGDMTSGALIINTISGEEPLRIKAKSNPNVYQVSAGKGFSLGQNRGYLNISGDYAYNVNNPTQSYLHYQRATGSIKYSKTLFDAKWITNNSISFVYDKNSRDSNPDDESTLTASAGKGLGGTINTNGTITTNIGWLRNIRYIGSLSYTAKDSYYEQLYTSATAPYSATTDDGTTLSNVAGRRIYDKEGNEITNFDDANKGYAALPLADSYFARYDIEGKELNAFAKITANFFKRLGNTNNRFLTGAEFKTDGNMGKGKYFDPTAPPHRNLSAVNASFRPRDYRNIPFINQFGLFFEENFRYRVWRRNMTIQAGIRHDRFSEVGSITAPRINTSLEVIPGTFTLRGGYGIQAKAPTTLYLYPEKAYFEYVNMNEMATESVPEDERLYITTTRVFDTKNEELKIARNYRSEIGFDLNIKRANLAVTAFKDRLVDGYLMGTTLNSFKPVVFNEYVRTDEGLLLSESNPVLAKFYQPTNNLRVNSKGIEFELHLGRFDAIRTSVSANGSWARTESYNSDYFYYDERSGTGGSDRTHIGLYEPGMEKRNYERMITTLRLTHNIPDIGFVITLTTQTTWIDKDWYVYGNDSIPIRYISKLDGEVYDFDLTPKESAEFAALLRTPNQKNYIMESLPPLFSFNLNLTKEIGDYMRVSFFANNMFRDYPVAESKRTPGTYYVRNNSFFFGLELSLFIK